MKPSSLLCSIAEYCIQQKWTYIHGMWLFNILYTNVVYLYGKLGSSIIQTAFYAS